MVPKGPDSESSVERARNQEGPFGDACGKPLANNALGEWDSTDTFETTLRTPNAEPNGLGSTLEFQRGPEQVDVPEDVTEAAPSTNSIETHPDSSVQSRDQQGIEKRNGEAEPETIHDQLPPTEISPSIGSATTRVGEPNSQGETVDYPSGEKSHEIQSTLRDIDPDSTIDTDKDGTLVLPSDGSFTGSLSGEIRADLVPGFTILERLGRGGMGVVFKAHQHHVKRMVALKMIRADRNDNQTDITRFLIEAETVGRLTHDNIVRIYQIGMARSGPFFALELLEGGTLAERLAGAPQPVLESASLVATLARAAHAAHLAEVIHRDLKPSNILFTKEGVPKIVDFGLAKRQEVDQGETRDGQMIGTPAYMSPEQAKGWVKDIGLAVDVYSLGVILYEMLTGHPPLKGMNSEETLKLVRETEPVPPSKSRTDIPIDLETICLKCLEKEASKRYASAADLADDLANFLAGRPIRARRTPYWERGFKLVKRHPLASAFATIGVISAVLGTWAAIHAREEARRFEAIENRRRVVKTSEVNAQLFKAQEDVHAERWDEALLNLVALLKEIGTDAYLGEAKSRAEGLLARARAGNNAEKAQAEAQRKLARFLEARNEALFRDTRFDDLSREAAAELTAKAAREGLGVFGSAPGGSKKDDWTLGPLPTSLSARDRNDITVGFYELLLILADAITQRSDGTRTQRAEAALTVLDRADIVRSPATKACHLRRAAYLAMKGDAEGARRERDEARHVPPAEAFDFFLIGRELTRSSPGDDGQPGRPDWTAAIRHLEDTIHQRPDHFWARCLLAICYLQTNEPAKARLAFDACIEKMPRSVHLYLRRGLASAAIGQQLKRPGMSAAMVREQTRHFEDAETDFRSALDILDDDDSSDDSALRYALLVNRGVTRTARHDLKKAEADLLEAIRLDPNRFEAFSNLGRVDQQLDRTQDALEHYSRAIELQPAWAPNYRGRAEVLMGLSAMTPTQIEEAIRDLESAILREHTGSARIPVDRTNQAVLLHRLNRDEKALEMCKEALTQEPRYAPAHRLRLELLLDLRRPKDVIESCDVALAASKSQSELYELRGMAYDSLGDFPKASADYLYALKDRPRNPQLYRRLGWSHLAIEGSDGLAAEEFKKAIDLDPKHPDGYLGRGFALARLGRYRDAVADAEEAIQLKDIGRRTYYNAARVYVQSALAITANPRRANAEVVRLYERYQDKAVTLLRRALAETPVKEQPAFRESIQSDPALKLIRGRLASLSASTTP